MKTLTMLFFSFVVFAAAATVGVRSEQNVEVIVFAVPNGDIFTTITQSPQPAPTGTTDPNIVQVAGEAAPAYHTIIRTALALPTTLPGKAPMYIHPFTFEITESCVDGAKQADGRWKNGGYEYTMELAPGYMYQMDPHGGYPTYTVGPFDHDADKMHFKYSNGEFRCDWYDDEFWKHCGECRTALWEGPALDCRAGGGVRVSH
jgi:hypothetical protein